MSKHAPHKAHALHILTLSATECVFHIRKIGMSDLSIRGPPAVTKSPPPSLPPSFLHSLPRPVPVFMISRRMRALASVSNSGRKEGEKANFRLPADSADCRASTLALRHLSDVRSAPHRSSHPIPFCALLSLSFLSIFPSFRLSCFRQSGEAVERRRRRRRRTSRFCGIFRAQ